MTAAAQERGDVSPEDVKRFIDPTRLVNSFAYTFEASFLPLDVELYNHTVRPLWALSHWTAVWAEVALHALLDPRRAGPVRHRRRRPWLGRYPPRGSRTAVHDFGGNGGGARAHGQR